MLKKITRSNIASRRHIKAITIIVRICVIVSLITGQFYFPALSLSEPASTLSPELSSKPLISKDDRQDVNFGLELISSLKLLLNGGSIGAVNGRLIEAHATTETDRLIELLESNIDAASNSMNIRFKTLKGRGGIYIAHYVHDVSKLDKAYDHEPLYKNINKEGDALFIIKDDREEDAATKTFAELIARAADKINNGDTSGFEDARDIVLNPHALRNERFEIVTMFVSHMHPIIDNKTKQRERTGTIINRNTAANMLKDLIARAANLSEYSNNGAIDDIIDALIDCISKISMIRNDEYSQRYKRILTRVLLDVARQDEAFRHVLAGYTKEPGSSGRTALAATVLALLGTGPIDILDKFLLRFRYDPDTYYPAYMEMRRLIHQSAGGMTRVMGELKRAIGSQTNQDKKHLYSMVWAKLEEDRIAEGLPHLNPRYRPDYITLCLTAECNGVCAFCYSDSRSDKMERLSTAQIDKVLGWAKEMGVKDIRFQGGELTFAREELIHAIVKARELGLEPGSVATNGWWAGEPWAEDLLKRLGDAYKMNAPLVVSVDSEHQKTVPLNKIVILAHKYFTIFPGGELVMRTFLTRSGDEAGPLVKALGAEILKDETSYEDNRRDGSKTRTLRLKNGTIKILYEDLLEGFGRARDLPAEVADRFQTRTPFVSDAEVADKADRADPVLRHNGKNSLAVRWDGEIFCRDVYVDENVFTLGNINERTLQDALRYADDHPVYSLLNRDGGPGLVYTIARHIDEKLTEIRRSNSHTYDELFVALLRDPIERLAIIEFTLNKMGEKGTADLERLKALSIEKDLIRSLRNNFAGTNRVARARTKPPKGSIYSVFKYLCDKGAVSGKTALTLDEISAGLGRSQDTIKYDTRALVRHLKLVTTDNPVPGPINRYYVPVRIKSRSPELLRVLERFRGEDLRPPAELLDQCYTRYITPILSTTDRYSRLGTKEKESNITFKDLDVKEVDTTWLPGEYSAEEYHTLIVELLTNTEGFVTATAKAMGEKDPAGWGHFDSALVTFIASHSDNRVYSLELKRGEDVLRFAIALGQRSVESQRRLADVARTKGEPAPYSISTEYNNLREMHEACPGGVVEPFTYATVGTNEIRSTGVFSMKLLTGYEHAGLLMHEGAYMAYSTARDDNKWRMVGEDYRAFITSIVKTQLALYRKLHGRTIIPRMLVGDIVYAGRQDAPQGGKDLRLGPGYELKTIAFDPSSEPVLVSGRELSRMGKAEFLNKIISENQVYIPSSMFKKKFIPIPIKDIVSAFISAFESIDQQQGRGEAGIWLKEYIEKYGENIPSADNAYIKDLLLKLGVRKALTPITEAHAKSIAGEVYSALEKHFKSEGRLNTVTQSVCTFDNGTTNGVKTRRLMHKNGGIFFIQVERVNLMSMSAFLIMPPALRTKLAPRTVLIPDDGPEALTFKMDYDDYTIAALIAMQSVDMTGKRVVDCGAGTGLLSVAALRLGASQVDMVELDDNAIGHAWQTLIKNGFIEDRDFRVHKIDLADIETVIGSLPAAPEETVVVSNIGGPWPVWNVTNREPLNLVEHLKNVSAIVAGGYERYPAYEPDASDRKYIESRGYQIGQVIIRNSSSISDVVSWSAIKKPRVKAAPGINETRLSANIHTAIKAVEAAADHLKGAPLDIYVDFSAVNDSGSSLEDGLKECAATMAMFAAACSRKGINIRIIPTDSKSPARAEKALGIIRETLRENRPSPGAGAANIEDLAGPARSLPNTYTAHVRAAPRTNIIKDMLNEKTFVVCVQESESPENIPDLVTAATVGIDLCALHSAIPSSGPDAMYERFQGKALGYLRSIFVRSGIIQNEKDLGPDELKLMVTGAPDTKIHFARQFAFPPAVKIAIDMLKEYYEKMRLVLSFA